ncbi:MAG TPA: sulfatase-like hydrolase/transferase [Vicinamibacterales bacterium]
MEDSVARTDDPGEGLRDGTVRAGSLRRVARPVVTWLRVALSVTVLAAPAIAVVSHQRRFGLPPETTHLGLLLLASAWAAVALLSGLAAAVARSRASAAARWTLAAGLFVVTGGAGLILAGAAISQSMWGDVLTYRTAAAFARFPSAALTFLPVAPSSRTTVLTGVAAAVTLFLLIVALAAVPTANRVVSWMSAWLAPGGPRRRVLPGALLVVMTTLPVTAAARLVATTPASTRGEPFSGFLELVPATSVAGLDGPRLAAAIEDRNSLATYPAAPAFTRRHVILLMVDALRADRMGVYGYHRDTTPFLSDLHAKGLLHRVDMALSTCSESYCGITTTLASRPFYEISPHNHTLHRLLDRVGYRVLFFLTGDHRSWNYLFDFYGESVDQVFDQQTLGPEALTDDRPVLAALDAVGPDDGTPTFFYFFLMSSHIASTIWPGFDRFQPATLDLAQTLTLWNELAGTARTLEGDVHEAVVDASLRERISNRYDNGVLQADAAIARVFSTLDAKGYLDDAIVVILGDHGDGLGEHGHIGHTRYLYQEDIRVPLLIYDSDRVPYRNRTFGTQIDVAPTIVQRLGLPVPAGWRGHSLLQAPSPRVTIHQTRRGTHPCVAAVEWTAASLLKFLRCGGGADPGPDRLYDLMADPGERLDFAGTRPDDFLRLKRTVDSRFAVVTNPCKRFECRD